MGCFTKSCSKVFLNQPYVLVHPPEEIGRPYCQYDLIPINKNLIPYHHVVKTIFSKQISKNYPNQRQIYTNESVHGKRGGAASCIPSLDLNFYILLPLGSFILSAELCTIHLALDLL